MRPGAPQEAPRGPGWNGAIVSLCLAGFLAPLFGGQVATDVGTLAPGAWLASLFGGSATPILTHFMLALLVAVPLVVALTGRRILQIPPLRITGLLLIFLFFLTSSLAGSSFRLPSLAEWASWMLMALGLFASVALAGRKEGPRRIAIAIFLGCAVLALRGIYEYGLTKGTDPSWRIFAGWVQPNVLAGMLTIGFGLGLGLLASLRGSAALLSGLGTGLILFATLLTQSKGGVLSCAVVLLGFAPAALYAARGKERGLVAARLGATVMFAAVLVFGLQASLRRPAPTETPTEAASSFGRLGSVQDSREQSFGYRTLLYEGALKLIRENPAGRGIGTYSFESARSGLTPQTAYAHNTYLQLGVEGGVLPPLLLIAIGLLWFSAVLRFPKTLPTERHLLRAGVFAAVLGCAAHNLIDSDLYHFGIGTCFFLLIGIGLQLAPDGSSPEFTPRPARWIASGIVVLSLALLLYTGLLEAWRARARDAMQTDRASVGALANRALSLAPFDGEAALLRAFAGEGDPLPWLRRATAFAPTPKNFRLYARALRDAGYLDQAAIALTDALRRDPNNLAALQMLMEVQMERGLEEEAIQVARRLVAVEESPYFTVRAIPELVPTETATARRFLASRSTDPNEKERLLAGAMPIYAQFLARTVPQAKAFAAAGATYLVSPTQAQEILDGAARDARELAALYRARGDDAGADEADTLGAAFTSAF